MNNTNDQRNHTTTRYCTCYVKRQVSRTIHVCRKCGRQIYRQDVLTWWQAAAVIVVLIALLAIIAYGQQHLGVTP